MKRNKSAKRWLRKRKRAVKGGLAQLTHLVLPSDEPLTVLENLSPPVKPPAHPQMPNNIGILRQDNAKFRLPNALADAGEGESGGWLPSRLVLSIIVLAVIFIAIIAWLVSEMPEGK
jgi:hypothetical protein